MKYWMCFLFLFANVILSATPDTSDYYVRYDKALGDILELVSNMDFDEAESLLLDYRKEYPKNMAVLHLEACIDFNQIFINERSDLIQKLEGIKEERLQRMENSLLDKDPFRKYLITEINLQWSMIHGKAGQNYKAALSLHKAWRALSDNLEKHPDFIYNYKPASLIYSLIGSVDIPVIIKKLFGFQGSIEMAMEAINELLDNTSPGSYIFRTEAEAVKACILFFQANRQDEAWAFIENSSLYTGDNILSRFLLIMIAQARGDNNFALTLLEDGHTSEYYERMPYMAFLHGLCKIRQIDSSCVSQFQYYIRHAHGSTGIKEAYQKLAWSAWLFDNDSLAYWHYMDRLGMHGEAVSEGDVQAQLEYKEKHIPDRILLEARLLSDGGYDALALIHLEENKMHLDSWDPEYRYRKARIYHDLEIYDQALKYYQALTDGSIVQDNYIRCNSALQKALIYECLNDLGKAREAYELCLSIKPEKYERSLHQKARTGLLRIEKW